LIKLDNIIKHILFNISGDPGGCIVRMTSFVLFWLQVVDLTGETFGITDENRWPPRVASYVERSINKHRGAKLRVGLIEMEVLQLVEAQGKFSTLGKCHWVEVSYVVF